LTVSDHDRSDGAARTVGVAVAVPEPFGSHLRECRASFGDPEAERIPPHITLLPPTEVEHSYHDSVIAHLDRVAATSRAFTVHLRGTASFRPVSPVVFVQLIAGIAECERLETAVRSGPLARELAFHYHPHVTVAHRLSDDRLDLAAESLEDFDAAFDVTEFLLYEHGGDGVWRPERPFVFGLPPVATPVISSRYPTQRG
jgi:2'-5' RNA ligase